MSRLLLLGAAVSLISPSFARAAEEPALSLAKVSKWEINYDEDSCHLAAKFGSGKDAAILIMTRTSTTDFTEMKLFGKMLGFGGIEVPFEVGFGEQAPRTKRTGIAVKSTGEGQLPGIIVNGLRVDGWEPPRNFEGVTIAPKVTPEIESAVTSITFKPPGRKPYRLETGSLAPPLAAMRACTDDLLVHWGFDPKVQATLSRPASPAESPGRWLHSGDFPSGALAMGHNGYVQFRLDVDPSGAVYGCRILYRTNPDDFADLSCKLMMQRAKMVPALDSAGKPVKSFYISRIKWMAGGW